MGEDCKKSYQPLAREKEGKEQNTENGVFIGNVANICYGKGVYILTRITPTEVVNFKISFHCYTLTILFGSDANKLLLR